MTINESFKLKSKLTAEFATRVTWGWEGKKNQKSVNWLRTWNQGYATGLNLVLTRSTYFTDCSETEGLNRNKER